ncbi:MAG: LTA synthase family protein [Clostridia bacterium]|nr:LTA synthase family protein [Clostridia bacterium]
MVLLMVALISLGFGIADMLFFGVLDAKLSGKKKSVGSLLSVIPRDLTLGFFLTVWAIYYPILTKNAEYKHYLSAEGYTPEMYKHVAVWCVCINVVVVGLSYLFRTISTDKPKRAQVEGEQKRPSAVLAWCFNILTIAVAAVSCFTIYPLPSDMTSTMLPSKEYKMLRFASAIVSLVLIALFFTVQTYLRLKREPRERKLYNVLAMLGKLLSVLLVFLGAACIFGARFINKQWSAAPPEQLIINVFSPTTGTELSIYINGFETGVIPALVFTVLWGFFALPHPRFAIRLKEKILPVFTNGVKAIVCLLLAGLFFWQGFSYAYDRLHLEEFYLAYFEKSDFIEENFADAHDVKVTFPAQKRNLIFLYLESMENSYLSKELGGHSEVNLLPNLTKLAESGYVFSNNDTKFGGPIQINGTSWSLASMVNQSLGIPMKAPKTMSAYATEDNFIVGAKGLGDFLEEQGYEQEVMVGSDARFGGLDYLYGTHGDYLVYDYWYAHDVAKPDVVKKKVWWGFNDDNLYKFAKEEITKLYETGKPFNFTFENADTHMPNGYYGSGAKAYISQMNPDTTKDPAGAFDSQYANVIYYSDSEVVKFVRWCQRQPWYENTTIVLIGDHLSMDVQYFKNFEDDYLRTQFNLILNPAPTVNTKDKTRFVNRTWANFDMLPTILAALGCKIEGDRLNLGTNLFSKEQTVLEKYGVEYVDYELKKGSPFYNKVLLAE